MQILKNYKNPIAFVTIAGTYRTGKSFLMNKLLNLSDTEGSNSVDRNQNHDAKIFTLAILISSYFIYNSVGAIDEQSVSQLNLTTALSRNIAVSNSADEKEIVNYMPKFLWILRDFVLQIEDSKGNRITAKEYLEYALQDEKSVKSSNLEATRKIRRALTSYFQDRDCITFPRPVNDEKLLNNLNSLPVFKLRKEFFAQLDLLKSKILHKSTPKIIQNIPMNSQIFCNMLNSFVNSINDGGVPNISTAWESLSDSKIDTALNEAIKVHVTTLEKLFSQDEDQSNFEVYERLKKAREECLDKFFSLCGDDINTLNHPKFTKLREEIDKRESMAFRINDNLAISKAETFLQESFEEIKSNIFGHKYTDEDFGDMVDDIKEALNSYCNNINGNKKNEILSNFLQNIQEDIINYVISASKNKNSRNQNEGNWEEKEYEYKNKIQILQEKIDLARERVKGLEREIRQTDKSKPNIDRTQVENLKKQLQKKEGEFETRLEATTKMERELAELRRQLNNSGKKKGKGKGKPKK